MTFGKESSFAAGLAFFTIADGLLVLLALHGTVPRPLVLVGAFYPLHLYWSLQTVHAGLNFDNIRRLTVTLWMMLGLMTNLVGMRWDFTANGRLYIPITLLWLLSCGVSLGKMERKDLFRSTAFYTLAVPFAVTAAFYAATGLIGRPYERKADRIAARDGLAGSSSRPGCPSGPRSHRRRWACRRRRRVLGIRMRRGVL